MTTPQNSPEQELNALIELTNMNPHILRVGIVILDLQIGAPFINQQIAEITGIDPTPISRNVDALARDGMLVHLPPPEQNRRLRPRARANSPHWRYFRSVKQQIGLTSLTDLFEKDWDDIEGWLRQSGGIKIRSES